MKLIEAFRIQAAAAARVRLGRLGFGEKPGRLELALDDFDSPVAFGPARLDYESWQERVVAFVQWAGPAPVRITARNDNVLLADMVRFCHRIEMPTSIRTGAHGLTPQRADDLVDRGMVACELVADSVADAEPAVRHLLHARLSRAAQLRIVLHATSPVSESERHVARSLGIDDVSVIDPWRDATGQPGSARLGGSCPVASARILLSADDTVCACPFHPSGATGMLPPAGGALDAHRAAIRACPRACSHPTLN